MIVLIRESISSPYVGEGHSETRTHRRAIPSHEMERSKIYFSTATRKEWNEVE